MKAIQEEFSCSVCNSRVHSIFKKLNITETESLSEIKACSHYKKGQYIFSENGNPLGLYCINHGKVKLAATGENGKEQILRLLKDGDVAGYRSLISGERYHCNAVALEDSSICFIPKQCHSLRSSRQKHEVDCRCIGSSHSTYSSHLTIW